ncbi:hypothetical protein ACO0LO_01800 [Undibacterium sp. TJN25]|uniref:hypothetical protein n=1 Tax=Undibacterium sp. TJN25 TaxID=3413056 RepID=UPI003BEF929F
MGTPKKDKSAAELGTGQRQAQGNGPGVTAPSGAKDATNAANASIRGLKVSSRVDGFRRAGLVLSTTPLTIPLSDLTDDQLAALEWDANVFTEEVDLPVIQEPAAQ